MVSSYEREIVWRPLLVGVQADVAGRVVAAATADLVKSVTLGDAFDLATGAIGAALLLSEVERTGLADDVPTTEAMLEVASARLGARPTTRGLWQGATGHDWANALLLGSTPSPEEVDQLLAWVGAEQCLDLVSGAIGVGVLGLQLGAAGHPLVAAVLDRLEGQELGRTARPPQRTDLGMAHGIAGEIAFLAGVVNGADQNSERASDLLIPTIQRLLGAARGAPSPGVFPHARGGQVSRLAWCYGDPGAALALSHAARALGWGALAGVAADLSRRAAWRLGDGSVVDAGLCHGSSGLAHVFLRLWHQTGETDCVQAARFWLSRTLEHRLVSSRLRRDPSVNPGLLTGQIGELLVLLSACEDREPTWDTCLLVGLPAPRTQVSATPAAPPP